MNVAEFMRYRGLLAAAVGAGMMLGAAGIFLYHQLYAKRRRMMLQGEITRLGMSVEEIKKELDSLRRRNCCKHSSSKKRNFTFSDVESEYDMHSARDVDSTIEPDDLEEFFDFSDEDIFGTELESRDPNVSPELLQIYSNIDKLLKGDAEERKSSFSLLNEYHEQYPDNVGILWRLSKACHTLGTAESEDSPRRKEYILQGCAYGQRAVELDDSCAEAHKWYAITVGSRGDFMGIQDKITDGLVFKEHVDKALQLNPNDSTLYHLLGRFKYEIATLSWIKRVAAKKICSDFPTATFQEALSDFMKAEELSCIPWKENRLLIAKCYISEDDESNAVRWLHLAAKPPVTLPEDDAVEKEIQELLAKYQ